MEQKPIIKINNLNVTYFKGKPNEMHSLKSVNLEIYPGEFIIFFGPSGCGKSTLLYSISGLETGIEGEIIIDGQDISKLKQKELERFHQQKIGMVFQAYYLIGSLSVLKNVILPTVVNRGLSNKDRKKKAMALLEKFGLGSVPNRYPSELSGGQQQRVAISRSLINDPDILLADEPVGNLDSKSAEDVMKLFAELNETQNKTVILVTHNPSHLNIAHRVFFIKDGELVSVRKNRDLGEKYIGKEEVIKDESQVQDQEQDQEALVSKDLELLEESYSELMPNKPEPTLNDFKAKEIILEVLTGMSSNELDSMEKHVEELFVSEEDDGDKMFRYLDDNIKKGGLGLDSRTAHNLTKKIKAIVVKINELKAKKKKPKKNKKINPADDVTMQIRLYLEKEFKINFKSMAARRRFHDNIQERLNDKIDALEFQRLINLAVSKGGSGINIRKAKKISNRLELLILGRYNSKI